MVSLSCLLCMCSWYNNTHINEAYANFLSSPMFPVGLLKAKTKGVGPCDVDLSIHVCAGMRGGLENQTQTLLLKTTYLPNHVLLSILGF